MISYTRREALGRPSRRNARQTNLPVFTACVCQNVNRLWTELGVRSQLSNGSAVTCLSRDAMRTRGLCCRPGVCLSVRLSVTLVYCNPDG